MKFAVQLKGAKPFLENVASCYQGDSQESKESVSGFSNLPHSTPAVHHIPARQLTGTGSEVRSRGAHTGSGEIG
jgi:hypothetical protein